MSKTQTQTVDMPFAGEPATAAPDPQPAAPETATISVSKETAYVLNGVMATHQEVVSLRRETAQGLTALTTATTKVAEASAALVAAQPSPSISERLAVKIDSGRGWMYETSRQVGGAVALGLKVVGCALVVDYGLGYALIGQPFHRLLPGAKVAATVAGVPEIGDVVEG